MVAVDDKGTLQTFYMRHLRVSNPCTYTTSPGPAGLFFTTIVTCPEVALGRCSPPEFRAEATASTKKAAEKKAAREALRQLSETHGFNVANTPSCSQLQILNAPDGFQTPLPSAHIPQSFAPPLKRGVYRVDELVNLAALAFPDPGFSGSDDLSPSAAGALAAVRGNPKGSLQEVYAKAEKSCSGAVMFQWTHFIEGHLFGVRVVCPPVDSSYLVLPQLQGGGRATTKKEAEQNAANNVLKQLEASYGDANPIARAVIQWFIASTISMGGLAGGTQM